MVFVVHSMSFPFTEHVLFSYASVYLDFHYMAPISVDIFNSAIYYTTFIQNVDLLILLQSFFACSSWSVTDMTGIYEGCIVTIF